MRKTKNVGGDLPVLVIRTARNFRRMGPMLHPRPQQFLVVCSNQEGYFSTSKHLPSSAKTKDFIEQSSFPGMNNRAFGCTFKFPRIRNDLHDNPRGNWTKERESGRWKPGRKQTETRQKIKWFIGAKARQAGQEQAGSMRNQFKK